MNKAEFISAIVEKSGASKKDAEKIVNAMMDVVTDSLKKGDKITLVGFGSFEVRERAAREGVNPQNGKKIKIAACKVPGFKAGRALKDAVNK